MSRDFYKIRFFFIFSRQFSWKWIQLWMCWAIFIRSDFSKNIYGPFSVRVKFTHTHDKSLAHFESDEHYSFQRLFTHIAFYCCCYCCWCSCLATINNVRAKLIFLVHIFRLTHIILFQFLPSPNFLALFAYSSFSLSFSSHVYAWRLFWQQFWRFSIHRDPLTFENEKRCNKTYMNINHNAFQWKCDFSSVFLYFFGDYCIPR